MKKLIFLQLLAFNLVIVNAQSLNTKLAKLTGQTARTTTKSGSLPFDQSSLSTERLKIADDFDKIESLISFEGSIQKITPPIFFANVWQC